MTVRISEHFTAQLWGATVMVRIAGAHCMLTSDQTRKAAQAFSYFAARLTDDPDEPELTEDDIAASKADAQHQAEKEEIWML